MRVDHVQTSHEDITRNVRQSVKLIQPYNTQHDNITTTDSMATSAVTLYTTRLNFYNICNFLE